MAGWMPREIPQVVDHAHELRGDAGDLGTELGRPEGGSAAERSLERQRHERCCAPSCRSRSIRRRTSSEAATIRAREVISSAGSARSPPPSRLQLSELRHPLLVSGGSDACPDPTAIIPHSRPLTCIGRATEDSIPHEDAPRAEPRGSHRPGRPGRSAGPVTVSPVGG